MKRHHKIMIGGFSTFVLVALVVVIILLNGVIVKQNIENNQLKNQITALQTSTNSKINELATEIINSKQSLHNEIANIGNNITLTNAQIQRLEAQAGIDFSGVIQNSMKSTVIVRTLSEEGSGFYIDNKGYIATNEHVIKDKNDGISSIIQVITSDGKVHTASTVGYIPELDLALLKTDPGYGYLKLADSKNVTVGEKVIAIGTPEGLSFSVTDGIVSATKRTGFGTQGTYIQTNAQLNPGNSGGPLIDQNGEVIGMNNFKINNTEGLGFALEADKIKEGVNAIGQKALNETLINY